MLSDRPAQKSSQPGAAGITATARLLTFEPGLYTVDFVEARASEPVAGLPLPCVRLDALPAEAQGGTAFVGILAPGGWIHRGDQPVYVRAVGAPAAVMLTVYTRIGTAAPELRVSAVGKPESDQGAAATAAIKTSTDAIAIVQTVNVEAAGDLRAPGGEWVGQRGSGRPLNGFALQLPPDAPFDARALEYQAILGEDWSTPWMPSGQFCGSRNMSLPLLGLRVRLTGEAAARYTVTYTGLFIGGASVGPVSDGEACLGDGLPMEAVKIAVTRRRPAKRATARRKTRAT